MFFSYTYSERYIIVVEVLIIMLNVSIRSCLSKVLVLTTAIAFGSRPDRLATGSCRSQSHLPAGPNRRPLRAILRDRSETSSEDWDKGRRLEPATRSRRSASPKRHGASSRTCARRGWPGPAVLSRGRLITGRREKTARIGRDAAAYGPSEN